LVEVPIQTPDAVPALEAVVAAGRERGKQVGSGTVTTVDQVRLSHKVGVAFTVSPGLDEDVVRLSAELGLPHLAGVATATEIQHAVKLGCTWVKAFPAATLGASWFKAIKHGPFPGISLVATGGMDASNAADFLAAGASMVAVGSALADPRQIELLAPLIARR
ncbi:MAG: bifunctional 4-hydroxy-2-oxoglutarate aldolase/2-dehydro-3-deoxy-phosphogluconate aldolase, partial [Microbacteriaceae bacterium]